MNVYKYINKVMIGTDVNITDIPEELKNVPQVSVDDTSQQFIQQLSSANERFIFVITKENAAVQLIKAINNFSEKKIGYVYNTECDITAIEEEILSSSLTDYSETNRYFPLATELNDIFHSESRILIKNVNNIENIPDCEEIFYKNNNRFGIVLSEEFLYEDASVESADRCIANLSLKEKAQLMITMINTAVYDFSSIYVIRNKNKTLFVPLDKSRVVKESNLSEAYLKLFLGKSVSTPNEAVVALANLPAAIAEDINSILVNRFNNSPFTISKELVIYSMKRLLI